MISTLEKNIVVLLKNKDTYAINLLYENYAEALYGVIRKVISDQETARDVLQESFAKIWRHAEKYDPNKAKLFTWLYRITYNTAIDKVRSLKNQSEKEVQMMPGFVCKKMIDAGLNQDVLDLKKHLSRIDVKCQSVIQALFFEGMTHQEASKKLNMPLGTIKSRLRIGLRELRKIYAV